MHLESRITWEKLAIELELLNTEDPSSLTQLLIGLNCLLCPNERPEWASRTVNFMAYDLMAKGEGLAEAERFKLLNDYFFRQKGFQIVDGKNSDINDNCLLIKPVLSERVGAPIIIALLYLHMAAHLDIPAYLIPLKHHVLLKWVRGGRSCYIDLTAEGQVMGEEQLVDLVNHSGEPLKKEDGDQLAILPHRKIFLHYAEELIRVYDRTGQKEQLHVLYNAILKVEPTDSRVLGRRALLRYQLAQFKDSLADFKRLFSFLDKAKAPVELQVAYNDLLHRIEGNKPSSIDLLH